MLSRTLNKLVRLNKQVPQRTMASAATLNDPPKRVIVTGGGGQIAYSIAVRIAA